MLGSVSPRARADAAAVSVKRAQSCFDGNVYPALLLLLLLLLLLDSGPIYRAAARIERSAV